MLSIGSLGVVKRGHAFYFWDGHKEWIKYQREYQTTGTLDEIGWDAGKGACTIHKVFTDEIASCNENHINNTACCHTYILEFLCFSQLFVS